MLCSELAAVLRQCTGSQRTLKKPRKADVIREGRGVREPLSEEVTLQPKPEDGERMASLLGRAGGGSGQEGLRQLRLGVQLAGGSELQSRLNWKAPPGTGRTRGRCDGATFRDRPGCWEERSCRPARARGVHSLTEGGGLQERDEGAHLRVPVAGVETGVCSSGEGAGSGGGDRAPRGTDKEAEEPSLLGEGLKPSQQPCRGWGTSQEGRGPLGASSAGLTSHFGGMTGATHQVPTRHTQPSEREDTPVSLGAHSSRWGEPWPELKGRPVRVPGQ